MFAKTLALGAGAGLGGGWSRSVPNHGRWDGTFSETWEKWKQALVVQEKNKIESAHPV